MSKVYWFTGLSGSGKSTTAGILKETLVRAVWLDGDHVRKGLCSDLGFSVQDRDENIRRVAEVAKLFLMARFSVIVSFISPLKKHRDFARQLLGDDFIEIYQNTPIEECEKRDPKGLYKKALTGELDEFTGITSPYEAPENPEIELTHDLTPQQAVKKIRRCT
jgi:adenylylsulfate kinase